MGRSGDDAAEKNAAISRPTVHKYGELVQKAARRSHAMGTPVISRPGGTASGLCRDRLASPIAKPIRRPALSMGRGRIGRNDLLLSGCHVVPADLAHPGLSNVRVVTRLTLVLLWPMSFFIAYVIDAWLRLRNRPPRLLAGGALLVSGLLMAETLAFNHATIKKADAQARLDQVKNRIPIKNLQNRILILAGDPDKPFYENELDAMLVAQDLDCPVLNGYSSNFPGNYGPTYGCARIPERIASYMYFAHITDQSFYLDMVKRVVPIGFDECDRGMWLIMPSVSIPPKPFP